MKLIKLTALILCASFALTACISVNYPQNGLSGILTEDERDYNESTVTESDEITEISTSPQTEADTTPITEETEEETIADLEETEPVTTEPITTESEADETVVSETEPPAETEEFIPTIRLIDVTSPIFKNRNATVTVAGKPYTDYSIKVIYSTGESSAKGLEVKTSDDMGIVWWSWKIGPSVKEGTYKVIISDGSEIFEVEFDVM